MGLSFGFTFDKGSSSIDIVGKTQRRHLSVGHLSEEDGPSIVKGEMNSHLRESLLKSLNSLTGSKR